MGKLVHFELIAADPKRAMKFYKSVLGWKFTEMGEMDYWLIDTGKGSLGGGLTRRVGIFKKKGGFSSYVCTFEVDNLDGFAKKVKKAGGKTANERGTINGVGYHQYFKDTEGNIFGALQPDTKAKMA